MINVYQKPTEKNPTLGFTYPIYSQDKIYMHNHRYENVATALHYFDIHKAWIIISVFEDLRIYFERVVPAEKRMIQVQEAVSALQSTCQDMIVHKENYNLGLESIDKSINFIRILVKNTPQDKRAPMIMMSATLINFCKEEINERQENQDQEQRTQSG